MKEPVQYLTKEAYLENARLHAGGHWSDPEKRWPYHQRAIELMKRIAPGSPRNVLEIGTMGASLVVGSDTLDVNWRGGPKEATIVHDARETPWPVESKKYECLVALRVFQHLVPKQQECFAEAKRIARNVVLLVPTKYPDKIKKKQDAGPILPEQFLIWNGGKPPTEMQALSGWIGNLYHWNERDFG